MRTGQIGICHNAEPGSFGKLVQDVTHSTAFHVFVAVSETECISPESGGALLRPISHFDQYEVTWTDFDYTDEQRTGVAAWALARKGRPYSWVDDIVIGLSRITGVKIPRWLGRLMSNDRSYMCSELAACAVFFGAGIRPFPTQYPGEVAPGDWDDYVKSQAQILTAA